MVQRILLVEDDRSVREAATMVLERAGFAVATASDGDQALEIARARPFDLIVLDVMLPGRNGLQVCRELREEGTVPIILLTARADPADVVAGLEHGADDYVTKPFDPTILAARIRAVLRRASPRVEGPVTVRGVTVDERAFRAHRGDTEVALTRTELRLLAELLHHAGEAMSREALLELVWGYDYLGDSRLVDMAVKRLRDKLGEPDGGPPFVTTIRGVGYRFERD